MTRAIALITSHLVGEMMSSVGLRHYEIGCALARRGCPVDILCPHPGSGSGPAAVPGLTVHSLGSTQGVTAHLAQQAQQYRAFILDTYLAIEQHLPDAVWEKPLIYDFNCIRYLESLAVPNASASYHQNVLEQLIVSLASGSVFIYSNPRIRRFLLGALTMLRRVSPHPGSGIEQRLGYVPFGLPAEPPAAAAGDALAEHRPGLDPKAFIILWNGAILDWYDPRPLIEAVARCTAGETGVALVFSAPPPVHGPSARHHDVRQYCAERGLLGRNVFFNTAWVPYRQRADYLLAADAGAVAGSDTLEDEFASRTRILDYLWAELPCITCGNDHLSELVEREALGVRVRENTPPQWEAAINTVRTQQDGFRENIQKIKPQFTWDHCIEGLLPFLPDATNR